MIERRRGDEFVTHTELRSALQPLFDLKNRTEPPLRFYEAMRMLGVEELLPVLLKDERTREVLRQITTDRWKRWRNIAVIVGILASITMVLDLVLSVVILLK